MCPIFISYSFQDQECADAVWRSMENEGLLCWIANRHVKPGEQYPKAIVQAIQNSRLVILLLSRTANGSEHVAREIAIAADRKMKIVPVRLHDIKPQADLLYFLTTTVWIDLFPGPFDERLGEVSRAVRHYLEGSLVPQADCNEIRELTERAHGGDLDAQYLLGRMNSDPRRGKIDLKAAIEWFRRAAEQGHAESAYQISRAYERGDGVLLSQADSLLWMTRAAQLGDARAQTKVGLHFLTDRQRQEKGIAEAAIWFERAAEKGGVEALYQLSVLRLEGRGVRQNDAMALHGFRLLAKAEHSRAQYYLAWMLANGRGTVANRDEALQWAERAADNGNEKALELVRELRRSLTLSHYSASQNS